MTAVSPHSTSAREGEWDKGANEGRLPSPMPLSTARRFYAAYDEDAVEDGAIPKSAGHLPHHFVGADGTPGAASVSGVNNALARLSQTQGLSDSERSTVERHLRGHQPDSEQESSRLDPDATTIDVEGQQVSLRTLARGLDEVRVAHQAPTRFELSQVEVRASGAGNGQYTVSGYASVTDRWYDLWPGIRERIAPEAFDAVLGSDPDVHALWDHDTRFVLARTRNRTLDLSVDERGLRFWARVADTSYGRDLRTLMERGDIDQASFAFTVADDGDVWEVREENGQTQISRTITRVEELFDVTVTAKGANPLASSGVARTAVRAALDRSPRDMGARIQPASAAAPPPQPELDGTRDAPSPQPQELDDSNAGSAPAEVSERVEHLRARIAERQAAVKGLKRRTEQFSE